MLTIEKRKLTVDHSEFISELKELAEIIKKHGPSKFAIGYKEINTHFKLKLSVIDFYILSEELEIPIWNGPKNGDPFFKFDSIETAFNKLTKSA